MYVKIVTNKSTSIHSEEFKSPMWAGGAYLKNQKVRVSQVPYETVISLCHGTDCIKISEYHTARKIPDLKEFVAQGSIRDFLAKVERI